MNESVMEMAVRKRFQVQLSTKSSVCLDVDRIDINVWRVCDRMQLSQPPFC